MREKDKLNLKNIKNLSEISSMRRLFLIGTKSIEGMGGGIGFGGLVITILALSGITVAFLFEVVAAVAGASIFGVVAIIFAVYQLKRDQKKINYLKSMFDHHIVVLKRSIIDLIKNYQLLEEAKKNVEEEIQRLNSISLEVYEQEEQEKIKKKIQELNLEIESLEQIKQDLVAKLRIVLDIVTGNTYEEKLTHLFGKVYDAVGANAIVNYAEMHLNWPDTEVSKINLGVTKLWKDLAENETKNNRHDTFQDELNRLVTPEKEKTHKSIKRVTYALTAAGGFLGGVGITITVGALLFGGIAGLTVIGWPVLVVALAVGVTTMVGAFLYYRHIEKKQQKTLKQFNLAVTQVTGMGSYIQESINKPALSKINQINEAHSQATKEVAIRLDEHEKCFKQYQKLIQEQSSKVKSIENEIKTFKTYSIINLKMVDDLRHEINVNILLLAGLEKNVEKIPVLAGSEEKKINLLKEVLSSKNTAKKLHDVIQGIHLLVDKSLHKQQVMIDKKHDNLSKNLLAEDNAKITLTKNKDEHDDEEGSESPEASL